jgi:hypothetical protein
MVRDEEQFEADLVRGTIASCMLAERRHIIAASRWVHYALARWVTSAHDALNLLLLFFNGLQKAVTIRVGHCY